jgi:hypothetical protein
MWLSKNILKAIATIVAYETGTKMASNWHQTSIKLAPN